MISTMLKGDKKMKKYTMRYERATKQHLLNKPTTVSDFMNDFNDEMSIDWEDKARKLQMRRWRIVKDQLG